MAYLLQQLLASAVNKHPHRPAVCYQKREITYRELDRASNQLAHTLRQLGLANGERVGIFLNKSLDAVTAIFGILKAGCVYVPIDPSAPLERAVTIIDNCGMSAIVCGMAQMRGLQPRLSKNLHLPLLVMEEGTTETKRSGSTFISRKVIDQASASALPDFGIIEDDLAYILYTSGSTGVPKGVMISHRASLTFVNWAWETFKVQSRDRVANHAPLHFDLSIFDIFVSIKAGATIVLVPPAFSVFPLNLADFISEQRISIWYSVPSALTNLVLHGKLDRYKFTDLHTVLFAGEVFPVKYLRALMTRIPHAAYYNLYGPTETNVCTWYPVPPLPSDRTEPLSIGRACANSEILVFNEQNERVPPGVEGELCVRGPGLMKGYWGMPEKSRAVLTPVTLQAEIGPELVYRTGDMVVEQPDGTYRFLGRRDGMIKSRGYRIELGEIEAALYSHPAIEEAAVVPIPDDAIGNRLHAYVVCHNGQEVTQAQLAGHCATRIPKYMIPHDFVFCPSLPKTSTGKIDRRQLQRKGVGSEER